MPNQDLIDFENAEKVKNVATIETLNKTIVSIDQTIVQMNTNIDNLNAQKTDAENQITAIEGNNVKIDQIIAILEAS